MDGKVAVITGAGSGIGRAAAVALAQAGYRIMALGRRLGPLVETLAIADASESGEALSVDVRDETAVEAAMGACVARFGRVDVLFNNAGVFGAASPIETLSAEQWREVLDINLTGAFLCARAVYRRMQTQSPRGGRIINCGSVSAQTPRPNAAAYTASKHALTGLTRALSLEGRAWDIACGQLDVGNAATELTDAIARGVLQADGERRPEPLMDATHVADAVVYMANLPLGANVQFMTVMATKMPLVGRG